MPVTNYTTANGRLRSQATNGVGTYYLTDALGSITATTDDSGTILNTYRYKPFGETLARTGVSVDPRFLWTGDTGSRKNSLRHAEQYNRARHFGNSAATWLAIDRYWPNELSYVYCRQNPTNLTDPSGHIPACRGVCTPVTTVVERTRRCEARLSALETMIYLRIFKFMDIKCTSSCKPASTLACGTCTLSQTVKDALYVGGRLVNGSGGRFVDDFSRTTTCGTTIKKSDAPGLHSGRKDENVGPEGILFKETPNGPYPIKFFGMYRTKCACGDKVNQVDWKFEFVVTRRGDNLTCKITA